MGKTVPSLVEISDGIPKPDLPYRLLEDLRSCFHES
jgi:hypothetical protein